MEGSATSLRGAKRRSNPYLLARSHGLLRCARNDEGWKAPRRLCEQQSDDAIHTCLRGRMDCFAALAMTKDGRLRDVFASSKATTQSILACAVAWIASLRSQ